MTSAQAFLEQAKQSGFDFFTGVPCSFLTPLINATISDKSTSYVSASSEGEAVAIASGAWLAGKQTVVMFQNSGLGNAVNPLTSLNYPFRIPTLLVCTWRAGPGLEDEPQHELMGQITTNMFDVMRIPHLAFPTNDHDVAKALSDARALMDKDDLPAALIMQKGDVDDYELSGAGDTATSSRGGITDLTSDSVRVKRYEALETLIRSTDERTALIATTGKCGRELFTIKDRRQHLYQVGSMGCAAGMGLGVALNTDKPVVVVDGDGALIMKMGTLATIGAYGPKTLVHVVLDNGTYDSTGGQPTVSPCVDFAAAAVAAGYAGSFKCDTLDGLVASIAGARALDGPTLIHMKILSGSINELGRPTISPRDVARRFKSFLAET